MWIFCFVVVWLLNMKSEVDGIVRKLEDKLEWKKLKIMGREMCDLLGGFWL